LHLQSDINKQEGSGFFIAPSEIVTAYHVVGREPEVIVQFMSSEFKATVKRSRPSMDYAILQLSTPVDHSCITICNVSIVEGDVVYFGGFPLRRQYFSMQSSIVTAISSKDGHLWYEFAGAIVGGLCGGPLVIDLNSQLAVIGIIVTQAAVFSPKFLKVHEKVELIERHNVKPIFSCNYPIPGVG